MNTGGTRFVGNRSCFLSRSTSLLDEDQMLNFRHDILLRHQGLRSILYLAGLLWAFLGVGIVADIFMAAIETITAKEILTKTKTGATVPVKVMCVPSHCFHTARPHVTIHKNDSCMQEPRANYPLAQLTPLCRCLARSGMQL